MKTVTLTPESSVKSTTTYNNNTTDDQSEIRDTSCYFPGCRKDANCSCDMCLASINATLDLMPLSIQRTSLTKNSKPISRTPISFNSSVSTPKSRIYPVRMLSPTLKSTARMSFQGKMKKEKGNMGFVVMLMRLILGVGLIFAVLFGFSWVVSRVLRPELSPDLVRNLGEESLVLQDLNERIGYLKNEMEGLVGRKNLNGSSLDFKWEINQDGLLLNSRCTLYKTAAEEVSIWGWPLQTAGLLTTSFSSRSFTILSGRVTEWTNGKAGYLIRKSNSSWIQGKWSASAVHFDGNTWILEYKRSFIIENRNLLSAALDLLEFRITRQLRKMKQEFWLLSTFGEQFRGSAESFRIPT